MCGLMSTSMTSVTIVIELVILLEDFNESVICNKIDRKENFRLSNSGEIVFYIIYFIISIKSLEGLGRGASRGFVLLRESRNQWSWP
jgi:hypothetical protein